MSLTVPDVIRALRAINKNKNCEPFGQIIAAINANSANKSVEGVTALVGTAMGDCILPPVEGVCGLSSVKPPVLSLVPVPNENGKFYNCANYAPLDERLAKDLANFAKPSPRRDRKGL